MAGHLHARRWTLAACLLVIAAQAVLLASLVLRDEPTPHRVPLTIAAPGVVSQALAAEADDLPGEPFAARWTDDTAEARADVREGRAVAAVLVDLPRTRDVLVLDARGDADLEQAVVDRLTGIERARDRTLVVERVGDPEHDASRVRLAVVLCGLLGLGYAVAVSLVRGPVAATAGLGVLRVLGLGAVSVVGAGLLQAVPATRLPGPVLAVVAVVAAYAFFLGAVTLAIEALAGLVGIAAVAAGYFVLAAPALSGTSRYLLPEPWPRLTGWTTTGATEDALGALGLGDPGSALRPALFVAALAVVAVLVLLFSRWWRQPPASDSTAAMSRRHWRLWVVAAVLPLALLMGVAIAWVPGGVAAVQALPRTASQTSCVDPGGLPRDVGQLNRRIATLQGTPAFQGADVGADVLLQDGRYLLVFGDTVRASSFTGPSFARNSMMLWSRDCVSVVLPPSRAALVPDRRDGVGYWPMSTAVAHRPGYDLVLVSTQRVRATGAGSFDFANLGPALAVFVVRAGATPQLIATEDLGPDDDDRARPVWGAALAVHDGWLYAYGTATPGTPGVFGFSLQVARVRPDDVLDAARWRYWDGSRWQRRAGRAAELIPAEGGVSQTLSVFEQGGRWYALSKRDGDLGDDLVFWTAPGPTGPFTATDPVARVASDPATGAVTYMPLAHPAILPRRGTMVVSYSRNNTDVQRILDDPRRYRPTFLRVPLPR